LENDSVFAVKDALIVDFKPIKDNPKADFDLPYDFKMASYEDAAKHSAIGATEGAPSHAA
jgi:catechol 1,2-dioxygenase